MEGNTKLIIISVSNVWSKNSLATSIYLKYQVQWSLPWTTSIIVYLYSCFCNNRGLNQIQQKLDKVINNYKYCFYILHIFINLDKQFCSGNSFEIPAEGRSVTLGGLYSAFQDTFYAGDSLWSAEQINNNKGSLKITKSDKKMENHTYIGISVWEIIFW